MKSAKHPVRIQPATLLTDGEQVTVARLAARCRAMGTTQVIRTVEDDTVVRQMRAGAEEQRDRAAYLSGIVVAEVSIARRRPMWLAALLALALLMTGCGSRTRINPGADLAIYRGSAQWMFERTPGDRQNNLLRGFYDPQDGSITIGEQEHEWQLAIDFGHELGHAFDHQHPRDLWELLARYESPRFSFNLHSAESVERGRDYLDGFADPVDVQHAMDAARAAALAEGNP